MDGIFGSHREFKDQDFTLEWIPTGDYPVAFVEILSSGNKISRTALECFLDKAIGLLADGSHLMLIALLPPGHHDPRCIHGVGDDALIASLREEAGGKVASLAYLNRSFQYPGSRWRFMTAMMKIDSGSTE